MKKIALIIIVVTVFLSCEKSSDDLNRYFTARIAGFDLNCSSCILEFPYDNQRISEEIGRSPQDYYRAINMNNYDYKIGQMLKVKVRAPEKDEIRACMTLYESYSYKDLYVVDNESFNNITYGDTLTLAYNECLNNPDDGIYICFDSVVNDSRCPTGVVCVWEGNATVRFSFEEYDNSPVVFDLNTHAGFTNDTIISGYKISLLGLTPYPAVNHETKQDEYKAELMIEKK